MMQIKEWKGPGKHYREKIASMTAGDRAALEYVMKVVSVMEKSTETFVRKHNMEKPRPSLN